MNEGRALAAKLTRKAGEDLYAAARLAKDPAASLWLIPFSTTAACGG